MKLTALLEGANLRKELLAAQQELVSQFDADVTELKVDEDGAHVMHFKLTAGNGYVAPCWLACTADDDGDTQWHFALDGHADDVAEPEDAYALIDDWLNHASTK